MNLARTPLIAGNWKMHAAPKEAAALAAALKPGLLARPTVESALGPTFLALSTVHAIISGCPIRLAAQDAFATDHGAYTGEVSAAMLAGLADYVIVGHSERRALFGDTDQVVFQKAAAVLRHGMAPIICVGEHLGDRDAGRTADFVRSQIYGSIGGIDAAMFGRVVVAYEPVWAIGTGRAATPEQAQEVAALIRNELRRIYGDAANQTRILYGGSVNPGNCAAFFACADVDGALVGGASLKAPDFLGIVDQAAAAL